MSGPAEGRGGRSAATVSRAKKAPSRAPRPRRATALRAVRLRRALVAELSDHAIDNSDAELALAVLFLGRDDGKDPSFTGEMHAVALGVLGRVLAENLPFLFDKEPLSAASTLRRARFLQYLAGLIGKTVESLEATVEAAGGAA